MIFKMLVLEQTAEKWPCSTRGVVQPLWPHLGYGPVTYSSRQWNL